MQNQEYLWYGYVYHFFKIKLYSYHNIRYQPHHSPLICQVEDISCLNWHVVAVIMHFLFVSKILSIGTYMYGLFSYDFRLYTRKKFSWDYQTLSHGKFVYSLANWWLIHLNLYNFICIFSHDLLTPHRSFGLGLEICFFFFSFLKIRFRTYHIVQIHAKLTPGEILMFSHEIGLVYLFPILIPVNMLDRQIRKSQSLYGNKFLQVYCLSEAKTALDRT